MECLGDKSIFVVVRSVLLREITHMHDSVTGFCLSEGVINQSIGRYQMLLPEVKIIGSGRKASQIVSSVCDLPTGDQIAPQHHFTAF
ncbi:hypothetical protein TNCV_3445201 [Trichonephila clavipes]|nr:hypothetical protein TNCV_3445201 [Trichonephila clavipes]